MRDFAALYWALDATPRTSEKQSALASYFRGASPADAAWALWMLSGNTIKRAVTSATLRAWGAEASGLPGWMLDACYEATGDLAETLALVTAGGRAEGGTDGEADRDGPALHEVIEGVVRPLRRMDEAARRAAVTGAWARMDERERLVFNKIITGAFRVGVARRLAARAVAEVAGVSVAEVERRMSGSWAPTPEEYLRIAAPALGADGAPGDESRPYPFCLAHALEDEPETLGDPGEWQAEWKWDGLRAQAIRRGGRTLLWSRGEELITDRFPEVAAGVDEMPDGTVLDGEILAWEGGAPLPFAALQRRIGRLREEARLFPEVPVRMLVFDLLEEGGVDVRGLPLSERRARLEALLDGWGGPALLLSTPLPIASWEEAAALRAAARERGVEGLMLKRRSSAYGVGRARGDWWKWKVTPYSVDAVLVAAQPGSGKRAGLYTDYTFALWGEGRGGERRLRTFAKAYSGLTDAEIAECDRWIRRHTVSRHGPVRAVEPTLVFEIAFERAQRSSRNGSGLAVRFPRILRWRRDKTAEEADALDAVRSIADALERGAGR